MRAVQQQRNLDQHTLAHLRMDYHNAHKPKDHPGFRDVSGFMPHPSIWKLFTSDSNLQISREAAMEFISTYQDYPPEVAIVFDQWLLEIQVRASM